MLDTAVDARRAERAGLGRRSASSRDRRARRGSSTRSRRSRAPRPRRGLTVGLEFHGGTLTATVDGDARAARRGRRAEPLDLLAAAVLAWPDHAGRRRGRGRRRSAPRLSHLHVYEWAGRRGPAAARRRARDRWRAVLDAAPRARRATAVAFLEFVADDDPDALRRDAAHAARLAGRAVNGPGDVPPGVVAMLPGRVPRAARGRTRRMRGSASGGASAPGRSRTS